MSQGDMRKWLEGCRTEADLALPEFAELAGALARDPALRAAWERIRRRDAVIRSALFDVPVPEGLEDRILRRLAESSPGTGEAGDVDGSVSLPSPGEGADGRRVPHGWDKVRVSWWLVGGGVAVVLVGMLAGWWPGADPVISDEGQLVIEWIQGLDGARWRRADPPTGRFPLPRELAVRPSRWQSLVSTSGRLPVVCYDLGSAGSPALLFVALGQARPTLATSPPASPYPVQRPWQVAAWRGPAAVYVLALDAAAPRYQYERLLRRTPSIAAGRLVPGSGYLVGKVCQQGV
ncbi:MAG: hypothetical protein AB7F89_03340 [Pirellulaceae bacterium]